MADKSIQDVQAFLEAVSTKQKLLLNPDRDHRDSIAEGLMEMFNNLGYYCCPCREAWGERDKDRDICCPCDYCTEDIKEYGQCYCGLFIADSSRGKELTSIPDRRKEELYP